ncbi:peptide chain release factor N(5)-glutamine methyltransferase [Jannaschia sp. M317]|uniref:peptide chain release factor N(5)-glutamine methyltransferase n=1 Tax=Jannaschia sp. M317 TaxID=2867011 RepID=UPI0021A958C0|nr:peptide chain release factor N(5)-glutamine methyltransferase [Jannaschia sp. M317]UWQ17159.1 peptide chain release factor N(5)-glutamine methyltransferase [Jannaschia sp. M317]
MTEAEAAQALRAAHVPGAANDAGKLARALGEGAALAAAVARRSLREPVSHILGLRAFWKHDFEVNGDVLDPRPDTETLVEAALAEPFGRVLDLGTGSGCILLSLLDERPDATGLGTDISEAALAVARRNATRLGIPNRAELRQGDWLSGIEGTFDLIVSNPPYITATEMADLHPEVHRWEPHLALTPGGDGLDAYRILTRDAPEHLTPGGRFMVEIGHQQAPAVTALFQAAGLAEIRVLDDLAGKNRVVSGRK